MRVDARDVGVARERNLAGQALIQHAAERIDVGTAVDRLSADALGRDVVDAADQLPALGQPLLAGDVLREPEVDQVGTHAAALGGNERVGRLHVPVDQAAGVRGVERVGQLLGDRHRSLRRERALAAQQRAEVEPCDVAHRDVQHAVDVARVVDRHDARMLDRGRQP